MAITYVSDPARLVEIAFQKETTYGTYIATSMTQLAHNGVAWGRNHSPVQGIAATGTTQLSHDFAAIRGIDAPSVRVTAPFGPATLDIVMQLITGSELSSNAWAINDYPNSYSCAVNVQRSGTDATWQFAGCYLSDATINLPVGGEATVDFTLAATSLVDPQSAAGNPTFPALTPATSGGAFVLKDASFEHSANTTFSAAAIPFSGLSLSFSRGLIVSHTSSGTEPTSITPTTFRLNGSMSHNLSTELWADATNGFQDLTAKESDGGYTLRYFEIVLASGATTHRWTMPVRLDIAQFDATSLDGGIPAEITFTAAGDDATPTNPTIKVEDQ